MFSPTKKFHKTPYPSIDPTRPELSAKGKTVIVTGGGTGIGAETAKSFAKAGASRIALLGRREQPLLDTKAMIEAEFPGAEVLAIATDMAKKNEVEAAFAKVGGKVDVLISNAAVLGKLGNVADMSTEEFMSGIMINLQGNVNVAKTFLKYATTNGVVVETNSAAAHLTITGGFSSYNVAKAATARFYSSLAYEHPEMSMFSVQPGAVATAMNKEAGYKPKEEGKEAQWQGDGASVLDGYDDVSLPANFNVWLASPEARFLKGKFLWANWDVDELKARAEELAKGPLLSFGLIGWPFA
ncbi:NAD(P)-binding protein [Cucurbitaria berberidis CBS 394.84]|uniref:NAD(P)-binding protein n=1 Tax=Cucurbitaria berberidis CBS 394.84 TaxID=1168544 RepID=A0A9P4GU20_9PLEO|nr:NAD(P)-binding protein [Cucurbitaria berberidis CBS 394.84]KAF1851289.1 NAD(P)-binding protein [Cucurbitaria berberidis CBS 394.84]